VIRLQAIKPQIIKIKNASIFFEQCIFLGGMFFVEIQYPIQTKVWTPNFSLKEIGFLELVFGRIIFLEFS
jgi:hypothetical protein